MSNNGLLNVRGFTQYIVRSTFGKNSAVGTSFEPVTEGAYYPTPLPADAKKLRVRAGDVNDTFTGTGARVLRIVGLDVNLKEFTEIMITAGASASALTLNEFLRINSVDVIQSGTQPATGSYSHTADIVIEDEGGAPWACIIATPVPTSTTHMGVTAIPSELSDGTKIKEAYIQSYMISVNSGKTVDIIFYAVPGVTTAAAPFLPKLILREHIGIGNDIYIVPDAPFGPFEPGYELGALAKGAQTPEVAVAITYVLVKDTV